MLPRRPLRALLHVALVRGLVVGGLVASSVGCSSDVVAPQLAGLTRIDDAARAAEVSFGVPADLTLAVSYAETRWQLPTADAHAEVAHAPDEGSAHAPALVGVGGLRPWRVGAPVAAAARALGVDEALLSTDAVVGIAAASAELRRLAILRYGIDALPSLTDLAAWHEVVADYGGADDARSRASYVASVYLLLEHGVDDVAQGGERVVLAARRISLPDTVLPASAALGAEYDSALWRAASTENYSAGRRGETIRFVVIHTMQGSYGGSISWFTNPAAQASAHYNLRSSDGEVTQMVSEDDTAWHSGNGTYNRQSVGIEHEGFIADPGRWYTEAMYTSSARLTRHLCEKYGIPKDRAHIIGHNEVPHPTIAGRFGGAGGHTDPGDGWDWDHFMDLVGGVPAGPAYAATFVAQDHPAEMVSGERAVAWIDLRNDGSAAWSIDGTFVGTTGARDRTGAFYDAENWVNDHRASGADHSYAPGTTGRFTFMIAAPEVTTDTTVVDTFGLVREGVTWFGPEDIRFSVLVHPRAGTPVVEEDAGSPPVEIDAGAEVDAGADAGVGGDAAVGELRTPGPGGIRGGCSVGAAGEGGPTSWLALAFIGWFFVAHTRRRR